MSEFESILAGIESAMKGGGLGPERMTHEEIFLEIKRALSPLDPDPHVRSKRTLPLRRVKSPAREKLALDQHLWGRPKPTSTSTGSCGPSSASRLLRTGPIPGFCGS